MAFQTPAGSTAMRLLCCKLNRWTGVWETYLVPTQTTQLKHLGASTLVLAEVGVDRGREVDQEREDRQASWEADGRVC